MSVYGELLRLSVEAERHEEGEEERPTVELALRALERRSVLEKSRGGAGDRGRGGVAVDAVLSLELSYDVILVRLCERLDIPHDLMGRAAGPRARRRAEERLAERLPMLGTMLKED